MAYSPFTLLLLFVGVASEGHRLHHENLRRASVTSDEVIETLFQQRDQQPSKAEDVNRERETATFWNRYLQQVGVESFPDAEPLCSASLSNFSVGLLFDFEGPIGVLTGNNIFELEDVLKDAYNAVAGCDQPGAFIEVDDVSINMDIVGSIGNNVETGDSERVSFTWFVTFEGRCRGCEVETANPPLFDVDEPGTCSCEFPTVEAYTTECINRLATLSSSSRFLTLERVTVLTGEGDSEGISFGGGISFNVGVAITGSGGLFESGNFALLSQYILWNYNALNFLNSRNCDPEERIITAVTPNVIEEEPDDNGDPVFSVIFNIVGSCRDCGQSTVIFGPHEVSDQTQGVLCPAGAEITCPTEEEFVENLQALLDGTNTTVLSASQQPCGSLCDDNDLCTIDSCDLESNTCSFEPVTCATNQVCDSLSGTCEDIQNLVPCVAVIDEWDNRNYASQWATFRADYPKRPFCLLVPNSFIQTLPTGFFNDTLSPDGVDRTLASLVNRDGGDDTLESDWFSLCDLGRFSAASVGFIGLFIDTSGSMRLGTVQASYDKFLGDVAAANLEIAQVFNGAERFVDPFLTDLVP